MKRTLTVIVDSREKQPWPFPVHFARYDHALGQRVLHEISTKKAELEFGDYILEEAPRGCVIERKKNLRELLTNCTNPRRRANFVTELERLRERCAHPVLVLEGDLHDLSTGPGSETEKISARDAFLGLMMEYGIPWVTVRSRTRDQRRSTGMWALALLLAGAKHGSDWITQS